MKIKNIKMKDLTYYIISSLGILLILSGIIRNNNAERWIKTIDKYDQIDKIVISSPNGKYATINDNVSVNLLKQAFDPHAIYKGDRKINKFVGALFLKMDFYTGNDLLLTEYIYEVSQEIENELPTESLEQTLFKIDGKCYIVKIKGSYVFVNMKNNEVIDILKSKINSHN